MLERLDTLEAASKYHAIRPCLLSKHGQWEGIEE